MRAVPSLPFPTESLMNRLFTATLVGACLLVPSLVRVQAPSTPPPGATPPPVVTTTEHDQTRPATTTASGTTGLWFVPTAEVLPSRKWSASLYRTTFDDGAGFT